MSAEAKLLVVDDEFNILELLDEVIARIRAILRRSRSVQDEDDAVLRVDDLSLNVDTHEVFLGEEEIDLSPTEFNLLHYLMLNANRVLSKAQILDHVWEYDFNGDSSIVESYISYMRRKLAVEGSSGELIQTPRSHPPLAFPTHAAGAGDLHAHRPGDCRHQPRGHLSPARPNGAPTG